MGNQSGTCKLDFRKKVIDVLYATSQKTFSKSFSLVFHKSKFTGKYIYELCVVGGNTACRNIVYCVKSKLGESR